MSIATKFELLSRTHQLVLENDIELLQITNIQQKGSTIYIRYSTEETQDKCLKTRVDNFKSLNNPAIQIYSTQKGVYSRHLIISSNLARSLSFIPPINKDYLTIDLDFQQPLKSVEDYRQILIRLNNWRFREPVVKRALMVSPCVYEIVNGFLKVFPAYFNTTYYHEIVLSLFDNLKFSHANFAEVKLEESLNYLEFNNRRLSLLQTDKIHDCFLGILKNWILCEYVLTSPVLIKGAIKILNSQQKAPHLDYNVGLSTLVHYLRQYN
jgi:hypothetical protein